MSLKVIPEESEASAGGIGSVAVAVGSIALWWGVGYGAQAVAWLKERLLPEPCGPEGGHQAREHTPGLRLVA